MTISPWPEGLSSVASGLGLRLDLPTLVVATVKLGISYLLVLPIATERGRDDRSAGLRTFPIVALASCAFVVLAIEVLGVGPAAQTHVLQGLVTGIGFIGGGAILKESGRVRGTATAASIWATSVIGAAIGYGRLEIALLLAITTFLTLRLVTPLERGEATTASRDHPAP
ncbi:MAG: MgtC/SapB family protein [Gemmatimonadaceae bacterium]